MGRSAVVLDEVGGLLHAAGCGDADAFAALYDRTASLVFSLLGCALGEAAAERATVRVYVQVWRTAPTFDPAVMSGGTFLVEAVQRECDTVAAAARVRTAAPRADPAAARPTELPRAS